MGQLSTSRNHNFFRLLPSALKGTCLSVSHYGLAPIVVGNNDIALIRLVTNAVHSRDAFFAITQQSASLSRQCSNYSDHGKLFTAISPKMVSEYACMPRWKRPKTV